MSAFDDSPCTFCPYAFSVNCPMRYDGFLSECDRYNYFYYEEENEE